MNYYGEIKNELINNEAYKKVKDYSKNRSDLKTYYNVGKLLSEAGKHYGEGIIKKYSVRLTNELGRGYSITNLKRMRQFYLKIEKGVALPHFLSWNHIIAVLPLKDVNKINYYIKIAEEHNLSYRQLRERIKSNEYERLDDKTKIKLMNHEEEKTTDFIKNPILIKNKYNTDKISEKMLKQLILEDLDSFLKELGKGFTYVSNEYSIKIGNRYNYIDILLYNIKDNRYVVIELKVTELKKEHIGQIKTYMNYIDKNIRTINQEPTIGIIICKKGNEFIMQYVIENNIYETNYEMI
ncbi:MAG: PDDEXK nuclease domain-containing protein [Candidatus Aphodocola sp.]